MAPNYVPRHLRFDFEQEKCYISEPIHEFLDPIPVTKDGNVVAEISNVVKSNAIDNMKKYSIDDFKIDNLLAAGVPLEKVNVNLSQSMEESVLDYARSLMSLQELNDRMNPVQPSNPIQPSNPVQPSNPN